MKLYIGALPKLWQGHCRAGGGVLLLHPPGGKKNLGDFRGALSL